MLFRHAQRVLDDGTIYCPFIHPDGFVGLMIARADRPTEYLYLNPSDHTDTADVPNVFLYHGYEGHPAYDGAAHHYLVLQEDPS